MNLLIYVAVFVAGLSLWHYPAIDPDLGWQLFGGAYLSDYGFPQYDPINTFNTFWFDYHWLAQIIMYKLYVFGGYELLRFSFGIIIALLLVVVLDCTRIVTKNQISPLNALLITLFYLLFISSVSSIRPQTISVFMVALAFRELLKESKYELVKLFVISVLLANIHIYWSIIPFLWFVLRILFSYFNKTKQKTSYLLGGLVLLSSAAFISPYGLFASKFVPSLPFGIFGNYVLLFEYIFSPSLFSELIGEFRGGLSAFDSNYLCILILIVFYSIYLVKNKLRENFTFKLLGMIGLLLALKSIKFINLASIFSIPCLALAVPKLNVSKNFERAFISILITFEIVFCLMTNPWCYTDSHILNENLPIDLCSRLDTFGATKHFGRDHVRVLTHFNHGGWCRWSLYQKNRNADFRVTTDGRTQFIDPKFFIDGFDLYRLKNNWIKTFQEWEPDIIVSEVNSALAQFLFFSHGNIGWKLAERDNMFAVFVKEEK